MEPFKIKFPCIQNKKKLVILKDFFLHSCINEHVRNNLNHSKYTFVGKYNEGECVALVNESLHNNYFNLKNPEMKGYFDGLPPAMSDVFQVHELFLFFLFIFE